jgi:hypothetical protein
MRISFLFAGALLVALGATAQAQVIVSLGSGRAHDCFVHAKTGEQPRQGLAVCNTALTVDALDKKNRAGRKRRGPISTRRSSWIPILAMPMSIWAPC